MRAIALISGGLDSILAARLVKEQNIEVIPVNFQIPFCHYTKENISSSALVKNHLGLDLKIIDIRKDFLEMLQNPRYGFGSNMNPCIDCKILMLKKAVELLKEFEAEFIVTGEVLGQRPMSQNRAALDLIPKRAGAQELVLRPLCAQRLPETIPEKDGRIDRRKLLNFGGRGRRPQIDLAEKLGIKDYPWPAGGCLLTDPIFARKLRDLIEHKDLTLDNIELLRFGRHFRFSDKTKLIVGRNERENIEIEKLAKDGDYLFYPNEKLAGPTSLLKGEASGPLINLSCQITRHYCDLKDGTELDILYKRVSYKEYSVLKVAPVDENRLEGLSI